MSWIYEQATGRISRNEKLLAVGYAGSPAGKNDPDKQHVKNVGPLPRGRYTIAAPVNTKTHGPYVLWLTPDTANEMQGRSDFGIHGDSVVHPGTASKGCIVLPRFAREAIWNSGDRDLEVVRGEERSHGSKGVASK